jgi:hypothetical protein
MRRALLRGDAFFEKHSALTFENFHWRSKMQQPLSQQRPWSQPQGFGQQPQGGSAQPQYYMPPGFAAQAATGLPSNSSTIVMLTYLLFVGGCLISPLTLYLAKKELTAIEAGRADPLKRDTVKACYYVNLIVTIAGAVFVVAHVLIFFVLIIASIFS